VSNFNEPELTEMNSRGINKKEIPIMTSYTSQPTPSTTGIDESHIVVAFAICLKNKAVHLHGR
jgi:hypothetical protein